MKRKGDRNEHGSIMNDKDLNENSTYVNRK